MDELISRQAAIDAIEEYSDRLQMVNWKENPGVPYKVHVLNWCVNTIRELPSAHPERKKGKWIVVKRHERYPSRNTYERLQCPFCKRFDNNGDGSFCGYCGAEMQKGEEDEVN